MSKFCGYQSCSFSTTVVDARVFGRSDRSKSRRERGERSFTPCYRTELTLGYILTGVPPIPLWLIGDEQIRTLLDSLRSKPQFTTKIRVNPEADDTPVGLADKPKSKAYARNSAEDSHVVPLISDLSDLNYPVFKSSLERMEDASAGLYHLPNYGSYKQVVEHLHSTANFQLRPVSNSFVLTGVS